MEIVELTDVSFGPYGRVLDNLDRAPTKSGEGWTCYSQVDFLMPKAPMGIGVVYCSEIPDEINAMERHVSREEMLWATTEDVLMCVDLPIHLGDAAARPNVDTAKVFRIRAGQAVIISRGTWHSPAFAVKGNAKYYFLVECAKDLVDQDDAPWIPFQGDRSIKTK